MDWPDNGGTMPSKSTPFTPSSILVRPHPKPVAMRQLDSGLGWRRRVLPPGPKGLLRRPFIAISGLRRHHLYRRRRLTNKDPMRRPPLTAADADKTLARRACPVYLSSERP